MQQGFCLHTWPSCHSANLAAWMGPACKGSCPITHTVLHRTLLLHRWTQLANISDPSHTVSLMLSCIVIHYCIHTSNVQRMLPYYAHYPSCCPAHCYTAAYGWTQLAKVLALSHPPFCILSYTVSYMLHSGQPAMTLGLLLTLMKGVVSCFLFCRHTCCSIHCFSMLPCTLSHA